MTSEPHLIVPAAGTATRVWTFGDPSGDPVLLIHGFRGDHHGLAGLAEAMVARNPGLHAYVPDLPGFGRTPPFSDRAHDLTGYGVWASELAGELLGARGTILGHSFGSLVVASGLAHGLQADRAVLINPIASPALQGPQAVLTQLAIGYYRAADALPEPAARRLLGNRAIVRVMSEVMAKTRDRDLRAWIHDQHRAYFSAFASSEMLLEAFRASVSHTVLEFAAAFGLPVLLIAGERDDITPLSAQLDLQLRLPDARLRVIPGTGHLVHYEAVADAAGWIDDFLREAWCC